MINIEIAQKNDVNKISEIAKKTFIETFSETNSEEDLIFYLENNFKPEKISEEMDNPNSIFFISYFDDIPCGYLKINFNKTPKELKGYKTIELQRIYILKEFIGKKIGKLLMEKTINIARDKGADYIWLGVWENNHSAKKFYDNWGFKIFGSHIFQTGKNIETDELMKLKV